MEAQDKAKADAALVKFQTEANARVEEAKTEAASAMFRASSADSSAAATMMETQRLKFESAKQQERAAKAEKDLLELREKLKPRVIPDAQLRSLTEALRNASPKGGVTVSCINGDAESCRFAGQFHKALRDAGWTVADRMNSMIGVHGQGIALVLRNPTDVAPPHLVSLMSALASAGLPIQIDTRPAGLEAHAQEPILVAVFSKP
jgi:hypothetical protein